MNLVFKKDIFGYFNFILPLFQKTNTRGTHVSRQIRPADKDDFE
jgi:hypothetical protein